MSIRRSPVPVSVVVPVWNDGPCVGRAADRIYAVLDRTYDQYQIVFVDDGSTDNSFEEIRRACAAHDHTMGIHLARHVGQHGALLAGLTQASGEVLVNFDVDLQGDPEDIPRLVEKVGEGFDMVCGWRMERRASCPRRVISAFMNRLVSRHTGVFLHDHGCFKAISRKVADRIPGQGIKSRFLTALVPILADRVTEVPVSWRKREQGRSGYSLKAAASMAGDFFAAYPVIPLSQFAWGGLAITIAGIAGLCAGLTNVSVPGPWQAWWLALTGGAALVLGTVLLAVWIWAGRTVYSRYTSSDATRFTIDRIVGGTK